MQSNLLLDRAIVTSLVLRLREEFTEKQLLSSDVSLIEEPIVDCRLDWGIHKSKKYYRTTLTVSATSERFKHASIQVEGIFSFRQEMDESEKKKYFPVLCAANLYGFARGVLFQSSGATPGGPLLLPLVDMNQVVKARAEEKKASAEARKALAAPPEQLEAPIAKKAKKTAKPKDEQ